MSFLNLIDFRAFLISLAIGLFFVYIHQSQKQKIMIIPSPNNVDKIQYKDSTENCFLYETHEVPCAGKEKSYEIQI